jgi:hypothetical protein
LQRKDFAKPQCELLRSENKNGKVSCASSTLCKGYCPKSVEKT